jgi:hypothetical protein
MLSAPVCKHFGNSSQKKRIGGRCEDAIASTSSPSGIAFPIDQVSAAERSAHYGAWGAMGAYK